MLPDEIKNRTLYPLLARPVSRFDFLFGKFLGAVAVSWISFALLAVMVAFALFTFGVKFELILLQYAICKMMGLVVVCAVSLTLSAYMTPSAATTLSFVLLFGSSMMLRGLTMAALGSPDAAWLYTSVSSFLPQIGLFDLGSRAANLNWTLAPTWVILALAGYMTAYSAAMLTLSWAKFRRRAI
jgi:ABC-type transport system involved in multi-copper enzyme maturation permease subunit